MELYFFILYFFVYGFLGWCTEVAYATTKQRKFVNRGFLNGPICPIYGIGVGVVVQFLAPFKENLILLYLTATVLVTLIEGLTGFFLDKIFHHKWWDYSNQPLNIGGYVCVLFSLIWGVACVAIVKAVHPMFHKLLALVPVPLGVVLIVILGVVLFSDLYVTASGILKFNRQLEAMEKIAAELRELSDKVGENIHENVMETMEIQEENKRRFEEATSESRRKLEEAAVEGRRAMEERMEELRAKYNEMAVHSTRVSVRLLKAFPKMESRKHQKILDELKTILKARR